ncbi:MAG: hypothetical protein ACPLXC_00560 [Candidatus Pacearchaeota archaeon]
MDKREIKEKVTKGWLRVALIIEVLGKPVDYLEKALSMAVDALEKSGKANILEKKIHPAKALPNTKEVFTTFAEIEILVQDISKLIEIIFDYMPSSIEIIEPANFSLKLEDANAVLNDLATKLHQYDTLLKKSRLELEILAKRLKELAEKSGEKLGEKKEEKKK